MAPSLQSVDDRYRCDLVSAAYASRLDALVAKADLWIHGHMHSSLDYRIGTWGNAAEARQIIIEAIDRAKQAKARSEEHTSELQSLMRISYAVFCLKKKNKQNRQHTT